MAIDSERSLLEGTASTGIPGLDHILRGGLPRDRVYLLEGDPGTGKTTAALQFLMEGVRHGESCVYVTLSENAVELRAVAASHGWTLDGIDLNELLVRNPPATFFYRAEGWSMMMAGICDGDILIVDRSVQSRDGDIVLATWDGNQPTCKVLKVCQDHIELHSRNPHCAHIVLTPETEAEVFAITGVVRSLRRRGTSRS